MASEKRNAMAELADRINPIAPHPLDDDYMKASRIIAELAKASAREYSVSGVDELIANFRAIAEEGVTND